MHTRPGRGGVTTRVDWLAYGPSRPPRADALARRLVSARGDLADALEGEETQIRDGNAEIEARRFGGAALARGVDARDERAAREQGHDRGHFGSARPGTDPLPEQAPARQLGLEIRRRPHLDLLAHV